jgi:Fic family protein
MAASHSTQLDQMLSRICGEYLEMPGLRLTRQQAQRLWGIDEQTCARLLTMLLESGFLQHTRDDSYVRVTDGPVNISYAGGRATRPS